MTFTSIVRLWATVVLRRGDGLEPQRQIGWLARCARCLTELQRVIALAPEDNRALRRAVLRVDEARAAYAIGRNDRWHDRLGRAGTALDAWTGTFVLVILPMSIQTGPNAGGG